MPPRRSQDNSPKTKEPKSSADGSVKDQDDHLSEQQDESMLGASVFNALLGSPAGKQTPSMNAGKSTPFRDLTPMEKAQRLIQINDQQHSHFVCDPSTIEETQKHYSLRNRSVTKSQYLPEDQKPKTPSRRGQGKKQEKNKYSTQFLLCSFISFVLTVIVVVCVLERIDADRRSKFCDTAKPGEPGFLTDHSAVLCHNNGQCMPCPFEAICENGKFECNEGFVRVGSQLCLRDDTDDYLQQVISYFDNQYQSSTWFQRTFRSITGKKDEVSVQDLQDYFGATSVQDRQRVAEKVIHIFQQGDNQEGRSYDQYCLLTKYEPINFYNYTQWKDLKLSSLQQKDALAKEILPEKATQKSTKEDKEL